MSVCLSVKVHLKWAQESSSWIAVTGYRIFPHTLIHTRTHSYQIYAIHKHDLFVIPISSLFFAFLSAVASDVPGLLHVLCMCVCGTAAKGPLVSLHSTSSLLPLSANKFHGTLCEPCNFQNNVNVLFGGDISACSVAQMGD